MKPSNARRIVITWPIRFFAASAIAALLPIGAIPAHAQVESADVELVAPMVTTNVNPSVVTTNWNVVNHGPGTATDVAVVVTLPSGMSLSYANVGIGTPASCTLDAATSQVSCPIGTLNSGSGINVTLGIVNSGNPAGTTLTVQALVTSATPDPVTINNSAPASITLQGGPIPTVPGPAANLGLGPQGLFVPNSPDNPLTGLVYWDLFNAGPDEAEGVTVEFTLPAGVTYLSADIAAQTPPCPFDAATRTATCTKPGTLGPGATTSVSVQLSLDGVPAGTPITVVATVRANPLDPDLSDNVRSYTWSSAPDALLPATGTATTWLAIAAALVLTTGLALSGAARRNTDCRLGGRTSLRHTTAEVEARQ